MLSVITGKAFVLGDNVDTDQIIPARYLAHDIADLEFFGKYALSGVPEAQSGLPQGHVKFAPNHYKIIVAGKNFGCGSSREHAPVALKGAGIQCVIAEFHARIFYRNAVNGGYLLPLESPQRLVDNVRTGDELEVRLDQPCVLNKTTGARHALNTLGDVLPIIEAGGIFQYARTTGMLR